VASDLNRPEREDGHFEPAHTSPTTGPGDDPGSNSPQASGPAGVDPRVIDERVWRERVYGVGESMRSAYAESRVRGHTDPIHDMLPASGQPDPAKWARLADRDARRDARVKSRLIDSAIDSLIGFVIGLALGAFTVACVVFALGGGR
jgi:hypothetical protein